MNIGPGEELVGIEVLDAKEVLGNGAPPTVVLVTSLPSKPESKPCHILLDKLHRLR